MKRSLCEVYQNYFPIGTAVTPKTLQTHKDLIAAHFNSITAENHMKPEWLHPSEDVYDFSHGDIVADFAAKNNMKLRGHTLVWHNQTPDWFFRDGDKPAARELALRRMKEHINTVMGHYKGKAYAWDVVNEVITDKPSDAPLRESPWLTAIGEDYIEQAFRFAAQADPDAVLYYNDYNAADPAKSQKIYDLVKSLLDRGVPVHGIGMQGHWDVYVPALDLIRRAIERYASLGVSVQITELDVSLFRFEDDTAYQSPPPQLLELQAERYEQFFSLLREYKDVISGVTLWGVADDRSWLSDFPFAGRKNWPLLFDDRHLPKAAFQKIITF